MIYRAILGTLAVLLLAGDGVQGQTVRALSAPQQTRSGAPGRAEAPSQAAPNSRPPAGAVTNKPKPNPTPRDVGDFFGISDRLQIAPDRRITAFRSSGYAISPPEHGRRPFDHRFRSYSHFQYCCPASVVVLEAPYYVTGPGISQEMPYSSWGEPGLYADPPANLRTREPGQLAPFDPTPQEIVERMLALAGVKKGDVVYDLGAGDGRIVIAAAKRYGAKAVGFEIDLGLVKLARENVQKQGVKNLVEIRQQDFLTADLSPATVVTLYLSYDGNLAVRPQLIRQLRPGARIVSYTFDMGDWQPKIVEAYRDAAGEAHALYLWEIGAPLVFSDARR